jgi:hypothetical protein
MYAEIGTIDFDVVKAGLEDKSIVYMDVRNRSELENDGKIVGSVNLPCKYLFILLPLV